MPDDSEPHSGSADAELHEASDLEKADVELGKKMASQRHDPAVKAVGDAGKIGDQGPLYAISAAVLLAGLVSRNRRLAGSGICMLAALGGADLSKRLTKRLVRRTRPHVLLEEGRYEKDAGGSEDKPEQSFPSGHMAGSVATARALSRNYPVAGAAAGVAAIAIGISRIMKGAHWPLDVAGGAVIGLAAEEGTNALLKFGCRFAQQRSEGRRR
ncbi:MAG: phosphatase PAP2 family protein [Verrucomicrobiota bacterium]|nr:phosphatase PAP2 family protein [Verrucomicrobiota bacterium]